MINKLIATMVLNCHNDSHICSEQFQYLFLLKIFITVCKLKLFVTLMLKQ